MCQALRELMKDEIDKEIEYKIKGAENRAEKRGKADLINNMYNNGITPEEISTMTNINLVRVKNIVYGKNFE